MNGKLLKPHLIIIGCLLLATAALVNALPSALDAPEGSQFETRCGWLYNPTPAYVLLYDRDAAWIIGEQGGHQAEGDAFPSEPIQWVETNRHYGYGCACLRLRANHATHEVIEITSARARPLAACRRDRALRRWRFR